jgi:hypothetical protein
MFDANHGGQMVNDVGLGGEAVEQLQVEDRIVHIMEARIVQEMAHLRDRAGIEDEYLVAPGYEAVSKMRSKESGAAGYQNSHAI